MSEPEQIQNDTPFALPMGAVLFGLLCFSAMDAVMKKLALDLGTYNAILWRYMAGLVIIAVLYVWQKPRWPRGVIMRIHIIRSIMIVFMAYGFFWGLTKVPLAEGVALSFIAPLIALYLAAIFLKETIHPRAIWASLFGLAGVGVMAYERVAGDYDPDAFFGICSDIGFRASLRR